MNTMIDVTPRVADVSETEVGARKVNVFGGQSRSDLSKQWISRPHDQRFLSLAELRSHVAFRREACTETRITTKGLEIIAPEPQTIEDTHKLTVGTPDGRELAPTNWSFGQLAGLAKAPGGYLRQLPSQIVADALAYGLRYNRQAEEVKTYDYSGQLLAATGPDYGRIFDVEVVEAVQQIAGNGTGDERWKVPGVLDWRTHVYDPNVPVTKDTTTLFASDRDVFVFLVDDRHPIEVGKLPDGSPDLMFRGFYISNSEVGSGSLKLAAFYLRAICCNRIMWGVENFQELTMRHSKYAPARFIEEARPALASFAEGSELRLRDAVEKAKEAVVAREKDEALEFLSARGFSRKRAVDIFETHEREEGRPIRSAWDAAQGITAFARSIPNNDDRLTVELEARKVLDKVAA